MDSQPVGGRFDGIFAVLAVLAATEALDDAGIATVRPTDLVAWTNEEVGRFAPSPGRHPWSSLLGEGRHLSISNR